MELPSNDGVHKLHVVVWQPNGEPKAVLQLSHGMIEFIERYEGLAQYLNEQDILVIGNDHLGHGILPEVMRIWGIFAQSI